MIVHDVGLDLHLRWQRLHDTGERTRPRHVRGVEALLLVLEPQLRRAKLRLHTDVRLRASGAQHEVRRIGEAGADLHPRAAQRQRIAEEPERPMHRGGDARRIGIL